MQSQRNQTDERKRQHRNAPGAQQLIGTLEIAGTRRFSHILLKCRLEARASEAHVAGSRHHHGPDSVSVKTEVINYHRYHDESRPYLDGARDDAKYCVLADRGGKTLI